MKWHRKLTTLLPLHLIDNRKRTKRVLLQLEELESRALLSAGIAAPAATQDAHPLLSVSPQNVSPQQTTGPSGETPQQIQQIYGYNQLAPVKGQTINGSGETIAIVDAYYDPYITSDANTFSSQFGLPQFNSTGGPTLTVVASGGGSASSVGQDPTGAWPLETSLDVEWAHAMAPQANIVLVEAPDSSNDSMFNAVKYAASYPGVAVVSMSWGMNEAGSETSYDGYFQPKSSSNPNGYTNPGVTFVAASGDSGAGAIYPAASPYVLSTGGTTLGGSTSTTGGGGSGSSGFGSSGFGSSGFGSSGFGSSGFGSSGFFRGFGTFASYGFGFSAFARTGGGLYRGSGSLSIAPSASTGGGGGSSSYPGESAWSGSGGGPASYEGYPSYQYNQPWIAQNYDYSGTPPGYPPGPYNVEVTNNATGVTNYYSARMTPDVAYNADPNSGYAVYDSIASTDYGTVAGWNVVGGTSGAAPQWAAIVALSDQARGLSGAGGALDTNQVLNTLYNTLGSSPTNTTYTSVFHDITTGSNGYAAGQAYDLATGLGSPIVNNLVPLLAGTTIPVGQLPTIVGSGYGGGGGGFGSSSSSGGGSSFSSFSWGSSFYGFSAGSQPGGGMYAGSGSLSLLPPASQGATGLNGSSSGLSMSPQSNAPLAPVVNTLAFSSAAFTAAPFSAASGENNLLGNISTLAPASASAGTIGSITTTPFTNGPTAQANVVFGASGWDGASLSWRLSSLGLPSPQIEQLSDDLSANLEDVDDQSSGDTLLTDGDSPGEDLLMLDLPGPSHHDEGDGSESDGGDGGDG